VLFLIPLIITSTTGYTLYHEHSSRVDEELDHNAKPLLKYSVEIKGSGTEGFYATDLGIPHILADQYIQVEASLVRTSKNLSITIIGRLVF